MCATSSIRLIKSFDISNLILFEVSIIDRLSCLSYSLNILIRHFFEEHKDTVRDIIQEGTRKANEIGNKMIAEVKEKMHVII